MDSRHEFTPLGVRRTGMIAVMASAAISLVAVLALLTHIGLTWLRYIRRRRKDEEATQSPSSRFITSAFGWLLLNLLVGDLFQALGFFFDVAWVAADQYPRGEPNLQCTLQSVLIQVGDLWATFASLIIAAHMFWMMLFSSKIPPRLVVASIVFSWLLVALLSLVGPLLVETKPQGAFYAWAGGWCWIAPQYSSMRLWLHYFIVFVVAGVNMVLYSAIAAKLLIAKRRVVAGMGKGKGEEVGAVAKIMLLYPIVYIVTILPLSTIRVAAMMGHTYPIQAQLGAGFVFTLAGCFDVIIYTLTRPVLDLPKLGRRWSIHQKCEKGYGGHHAQVPEFRPVLPQLPATSVDSGDSTLAGSISKSMDLLV